MRLFRCAVHVKVGMGGVERGWGRHMFSFTKTKIYRLLMFVLNNVSDAHWYWFKGCNYVLVLFWFLSLQICAKLCLFKICSRVNKLFLLGILTYFLSRMQFLTKPPTSIKIAYSIWFRVIYRRMLSVLCLRLEHEYYKRLFRSHLVRTDCFVSGQGLNLHFVLSLEFF